MTTTPEQQERLDRIQDRTMELCDEDRWNPEVAQFARLCWLDAQNTPIGAVTVERMVAFAEELFGALHPGAPQ